MSVPVATRRWSDRLVTRHYSARPEPSDAGDDAVMAAYGHAVDGARVLDVGIGAGRTTSLLAPRAARYLGVDVAPAMLARARRAHPGRDLRLADARDLSGIVGDGQFDLVTFSYNGIDAVDHEDRLRVLAEVRRALVAGGLAVLSTHSLDSPGTLAAGPSLRAALKLDSSGPLPRRAARQAYKLAMYLVAERNWRRRPTELPSGDGWAMWPLPAHEFRFVCHRVRFAEWLRELRDAGLEPEAAWTNEGEPVDLATERVTAPYVQTVARAV